MKKAFFLIVFFILLACLLGCGREKHYVKVPPSPPPVPPSSPRVVALPERKVGEIPKSYEVFGERYYPLPDAEGFVEIGKASWYGLDFHGRPTSSGEIYNMYGKSAAHKTLPLDTVVKITNLSNSKEIIVPVNDRGPFIKGRIIDLSYGAARELDMVGPGVVDVQVVALGKEVGRMRSEEGYKTLIEWKDLRRGEFTIQIGAFENRENAYRLAERMKALWDYVNVAEYQDPKGKTLYRVHVSKSTTLDQAGEMEKRLQGMGYPDAFIVRL